MRTATLRQIRSELLAMVARIDEALDEPDAVDIIKAAFPGAEELTFSTPAELIEVAQRAGYDAQLVKRVAAEVLGPPTPGTPRTPDQLARVWDALTRPGGES